ncbi:hypothetical protein PNEG_00200 [Pneumocystis murina B123]|uniref:L-type lectin-like domain-containing protein n=1 Tax=Pneumocystis murina (strain B123) TaxID=1069680 RepID=M7NSQ7_PNEMU|nr:hypothetical protein PNEG_00200 [Pneumocystis murina B123]EMR11773.1 hypothetical protein PNEG_00200 [Pneumocystis murina B123]
MIFILILYFLNVINCYDSRMSLFSPFEESLSENWDMYGSVKIQENRIVFISPEYELNTGSIWQKHRNIHEEWYAKISLSLTHIESENFGFALWYTSERGKTGIVFGSKDRWDGLGIFLNIGLNKKPSIRGHLNDGSMEYSKFKNPLIQAFGACSIIYQNPNETLTFKLSYSRGIIQIELNDTICFKTTQINLPSDYYFGISTQSENGTESLEIYSFEVDEMKNNYVDSNEYIYTDIHKEDKNIKNDSNSNSAKILNDLPTLLNQLLNITNEQLIIKNTVKNINESLNSLSKAISNSESKLYRNEEEIINIFSDKMSRSISYLLEYKQRNETFLMLNLLSESIAEKITSINSNIKFFIIINIIIQIILLLTYIIYKRRTDEYPRKIL